MAHKFADESRRLDEEKETEKRKQFYAQIVIAELHKGERTWFLEGSYHEREGFTVFPVRKEEVELRSTGRISRVLSLKEAQSYAQRRECTNWEKAQDLIGLYLQPLSYLQESAET